MFRIADKPRSSGVKITLVNPSSTQNNNIQFTCEACKKNPLTRRVGDFHAVLRGVGLSTGLGARFCDGGRRLMGDF